MKRVVLPIETKVREFNGKLWLAAHLAGRGYKVALGELSALKENLDHVKPHIYIGDSAVYKEAREILYRSLQQAGVKVVVHDTEGGIIYSADYYKGRLSNRILKDVDCFMSWGPETAQIFRDNVTVENILLRSVGNPSFDLLHKKYRSFYFDKRDAILEKFGRFVLLNTHFGFYNHCDPEKFVEPLRPKWPGMYQFKKKLFYAFVETFKQLASTNNDLNFVVRPHPSENFDTYRNTFKTYPNVFVEHSDSVHPWALAARMVVHNGCTTAVETALLGQPVVAYRPVRDDVWEGDVPNFISIEANNPEELQKSIDYYCQESTIHPGKLDQEQKELIENCLDTQDGNAAQRICDTFDLLDISEEREIGTINKTPCIKKIKKVLSLMLSVLQLRKNQDKVLDSYNKQKFSGISLEELNTLLKKMVHFAPDMKDVVVEQDQSIETIFWIYRQ